MSWFDCCSIFKPIICPPPGSSDCSSTPNIVLTDEFQSIGCHLFARLAPRRPNLTWEVRNENRSSRCDVIYDLTNASGQTMTTLPLSVGPDSTELFFTRNLPGGPFVSVKAVSVACRVIECNCTRTLTIIPPFPSIDQSMTYSLGDCGASFTVSQVQIGSSTNLSFELSTNANCGGIFNLVFVFTSGEPYTVTQSLNVNSHFFFQIAGTETTDYQSVTLNYTARF